MTTSRRARRFCLIATLALSGVTAPALAQADGQATTSPSPSIWKDLFADTIRDFKSVPTADTAEWLVIGGFAAAGGHQADPDILHTLSKSKPLHETFEAGSVIGQSPVQLGAAFTTYALGRMTGHPRVTAVGADLFRAQLMAEGFTVGLKHSIRRARPEGSGFSFPSGHTTVTFASATVLQRHFGWKAGVPAYLVAAYVGVSRVQMRRHNFSDVAFGAALGIVAGHSVTLGRSHRLALAPMATPGGGGVEFSWKGRP